MPAACACRCTVEYSHCSVSLRGCAITCAPVVRLATHLEIIKENSEPPKPNSAAMINRPPNCCEFTPRTDMTMLTSASTAMLVARNRKVRFNMGIPGSRAQCAASLHTVVAPA